MDKLTQDEIYMNRCLQLALNGQGRVAPNPMVGCVIVHNQQVIGEGYHAVYGGPHAEVVALEGIRDKSVLKESTLYVSLEPCSHHGKTPPCTDAIIELGIKRVVIATLDANPEVNGKGVEALRNAGIEVTTGVLEKAARDQNRRFFTYQEQKRPYIILKWAQTLDGYIDGVRKPDDPIAPVWISNELSRTLVHRWRGEEQAILIGSNTVEKDNPRLDVRCWEGKNPIRIVLDRTLRLPMESNVFDGSVPTLVFVGNNTTALTRKKQLSAIPNLEVVVIDFAKGLEVLLLEELYNRKITSLIIEGGAMLINSFVQRKLWDEARVFVGNSFFHEGVRAPQFKGELHSYDELGSSCLFTYRNCERG